MCITAIMSSRRAGLIVLLTVLSAAGPVRLSRGDGLGRLTFNTRKAVVFKDGYALLIKEAKGIADASGRVFTLDVPDSAVLGSFWATCQERQIVAMRAEYTDEWKRVDVPPVGASGSLSGLLNQLNNKLLTLTLTDGREVVGTLVGRTTIDERPMVLVRAAAPLDAPQAKDEILTLPQSDIVTLNSPALHHGGSADPTFTRAKRLSMDLGADSAGKPVQVTLMYFTPGIRWIPTYRLSGDLKDDASMALQAEILNQVDDLKDVTLDLVVGVPHLRFRDVISPLSLEGALRNTLVQAAPQLMGQMSNAMFTQRSGEYRTQPSPSVPTVPADVNLPAELGATGEQDLFVYSVPKFSLGAGGRATVPLWQAQAPLRHLYTLDVGVVRNARHGGVVRKEPEPGYPADSPLRLLTTQVWHQLELHNASQVPWTTGAAMILRGELPVGQDLLTYAPPGGTSLLPVTVAVNIRGTLTEEEIERKTNVLNWGGHSYSLIRKKGTVTVTSFRSEASDMRVTVSLPGRAEEVSGDGAIVLDDHHPADWQGGGFWQNNHSELTWKLELAPGQTVELTYEVSFYVP